MLESPIAYDSVNPPAIQLRLTEITLISSGLIRLPIGAQGGKRHYQHAVPHYIYTPYGGHGISIDEIGWKHFRPISQIKFSKSD